MIDLTRFGHWSGEKSDMTQKLSHGWLGEQWGHEQKPGSQAGSACLGVYDEVIVAKLRFRVMLVEMFLEAVEDSEHVSERSCIPERRGGRDSEMKLKWSYTVEIKISESSREVGKEEVKF